MRRTIEDIKAQFLNFFSIGPEEWADFISSRYHQPLFSRYRARFICSRVFIMAAIFAVLTPLWAFIDFYTFPSWVATILADGRGLTAIAFALLALLCRGGGSIKKAKTSGGLLSALSFRFDRSVIKAKVAVGFLLAIPSTFFLLSRLLLAGVQLNTLGTSMAVGYTFLPFVLMTGLALFPFTVMETMLFSIPMLLVFLFSDLWRVSSLLPGLSDITVIWLLVLIATVSTMASLSQLQLMKGLFQQSSLDALTQVFNRLSGEQYLDVLFAQAQRHNFPITVAFLDLDNFKNINDQFGHKAGDVILVQSAMELKSGLRKGDILIRWGGEEFLVIMPYAQADQARIRLEDIARTAVLRLPDGAPLTWSGGIAQWPDDTADDWQALVAVADARMYQAKKSGKARLESTHPASLAIIHKLHTDHSAEFDISQP